MPALGVSKAPVRTAIYGPGVWPCVSLSFLYKLIFRHVIKILTDVKTPFDAGSATRLLFAVIALLRLGEHDIQTA